MNERVVHLLLHDLVGKGILLLFVIVAVRLLAKILLADRRFLGSRAPTTKLRAASIAILVSSTRNTPQKRPKISEDTVLYRCSTRPCYVRMVALGFQYYLKALSSCFFPIMDISIRGVTKSVRYRGKQSRVSI